MKKSEPFKFKLAIERIVVIWQHWLLRINDPHEQKALYTLEINNNVALEINNNVT